MVLRIIASVRASYGQYSFSSLDFDKCIYWYRSQKEEFIIIFGKKKCNEIKISSYKEKDMSSIFEWLTDHVFLHLHNVKLKEKEKSKINWYFITHQEIFSLKS